MICATFRPVKIREYTFFNKSNHKINVISPYFANLSLRPQKTSRQICSQSYKIPGAGTWHWVYLVVCLAAPALKRRAYVFAV